MGYLIDTNVLSELHKGERADSGVRDWYLAAKAEDLYLSVLVLGEVRRGIERLRRRDPAQAERLEVRVAAIRSRLGNRVLPVTDAVAERWGRLNVPDPLPVVDGLLAATALEHGLTFVTRNIGDVERTGARLLNPFSADGGP